MLEIKFLKGETTVLHIKSVKGTVALKGTQSAGAHAH